MTKRKDPKDLKKVGRKSSYKPAMAQKVVDYTNRCMEAVEGQERELPTRAGVAVMLKVSLAAIDTYEKTYPEFKGALNIVRSNQQQQLINRGLNGTGNSTIAKLLLSANHGMIERKDLNVSGDLNITLVDYGNA